jgi:hypothetical protein
MDTARSDQSDPQLRLTLEYYTPSQLDTSEALTCMLMSDEDDLPLTVWPHISGVSLVRDALRAYSLRDPELTSDHLDEISRQIEALCSKLPRPPMLHSFRLQRSKSLGHEERLCHENYRTLIMA